MLITVPKIDVLFSRFAGQVFTLILNQAEQESYIVREQSLLLGDEIVYTTNITLFVDKKRATYSTIKPVILFNYFPECDHA